MTELKEPLVKKADMTDEEWEKLESLCEKYQELNPDWERTGFETIEDVENLIAETEREKADKVFEDADRANAKKQAEEVRQIAIDYLHGLREASKWKIYLNSVLKLAKDKGYSKAQIEAIVYTMNVQVGFERMVLEMASEPYIPTMPKIETDESEGTEGAGHEEDTAE